MNTADQKSIFGVLVGLMALFLLWLWASGNAKALWSVASGTTTPASGTTTTAGATNTGATSVGSGYGSNSTISTIAVPQYVNTTAAVQPPSAQAIGGLTLNGAMSGGVQVTPSVFYNSTSVPATTQIAASSTPASTANTSFTNWLQNVLDPLGIGGGSISKNASFGTYNDPADSGDTASWGTYDDAPVLADAQSGNYEPN